MQKEVEKTEHLGKREQLGAHMVNVYINGKRHIVPEHATIMRAIEYAGIETDLISPLILPSYTPEDVKNHQLARLGNIPALHSMLRSGFAPGRAKHAPMIRAGATP